MLKGEENTGQPIFLRKQGKTGPRESGDQKSALPQRKQHLCDHFVSVKAPERHNG